MSGHAASTATVTRTIEMADTDASGHYHCSTAIRLFEAAEAELLDGLGLIGVYPSMPRARVAFDYRSVLWFRDVVESTVTVAEVGRTSITYSFELRRDGEICVDGNLVAVKVDGDGKPDAWTDEERARFDPA